MAGPEPNPARSYTVLARRFRPQTFDEVVGQQQIGQALRNAICANRVAHAYLFTGARGVGKTSTARIFAKALNCPQAHDAVPCNDCEVCRSIAAGSDIDVLEIDGASNRGIDDIRLLRSNVNVRSMRSPCKIYIIDEVHMLTKEAFNALLKTLEEPPPDVKFVFCTTEPNKVPDTILSRCQRFDFGFIQTDDIAARLTDIASRDGIEVDPDAVSLVARRAGGSMRDSQSLFDQLLAFGSERITVADVHRLLGTAPDERLFSLFESILGKDRRGVLQQLDEALTQGVQIGSLAEQLLSFLRDLLIAAAEADSVPLLSVGPGQRERVKEISARWGLRSISFAMQVMAECRSRMQRATYGRALVELALIRLTMLNELEALADLTDRIGENSSSGGTSTTASRGTSSPPVKMRGPSDDVKKKPPNREAGDLPEASEHAETLRPASENLHTAVCFDEANVAAEWNGILRRLPEQLGSHLSKSVKCAISGPNGLEIMFGPSYFLSKAYCERPEVANRLSAVLAEVFGRPIRVAFQIESSSRKREASPSSEVVYNRRPTGAAQDDPFVQQALNVFGGSVVELRETPGSLTDPGGGDS